MAAISDKYTYALAAAAVAAAAAPPESDAGANKRRKSAVKKMKRNCSFDAKMELWLHRIPKRLFVNGSSEVASLFSKQGKKGINQDAMIVWEVSFSFFGLYRFIDHWYCKLYVFVL